MTDQWLQALENRHNICAVFFDFYKAFDSVLHKPLLANRRQVIAVNGAESSEATVISGVLQGSMLGPLLFPIYINDLPCVVQSLLSLFANDTLSLLLSTMQYFN